MKQIVLKNRGSSLSITGFGKVQGVISENVHAAIVARHPNLASKFEVVEVKEPAGKIESSKK